MILSQFVRGAAEVLGAGDGVDGPTVARAMRGACEAADAAVRRPVEGTMLSVARARGRARPRHRGPADAADAVLAAAPRGAGAGVEETPEQLAVLARRAWSTPAAWAW